MKKKMSASILLVAPDITNRNNVSSRLRMQGFEIENATGGFHTINLLEKNNYDIVLIYHHMPDMSAYEMIGLIRTIKRIKTIPIIFLTKDDLETEREEATALGASKVISYSSDFNSLLVTIHSFTKPEK